MKPTLRICQVSAAYYPYPSGLSEHIHHLTIALRQRGHEVEILTTNFGDRTKGVGNRESDVGVLSQTPDPRPLIPFPGITRIGRAFLLPANKSYATVPFGLGMSGQVKRFLRAHDFDVVHVHGIFPPEISFWALHHSQSLNVITFHTVGFRTSRVAAALCRTLMRKWNRKLNGRIVESQAALRYTQPLFPGEYRIIPPGVDSDRFRPTASRLREIENPKSEIQNPRVLFVGRLDERKGLSVLLRAMPLVRQQLPDVELVVVGKGPMEHEARTLAAQLNISDCVQFKGFAPNEELPQYYAAADVYCSPALGGEAFGIVLLEAMASGAPVVASDVTGYNEVVKDGDTGLLCPVNDHQALAAKLLQVLTDAALRTRLSVNGLRQAEQYSWAKIAEQIEGYYREVGESSAIS